MSDFNDLTVARRVQESTARRNTNMICMDVDHEHLSEQDARSCGCDHEWDFGDSESAPIYCGKCGADGLA